MKYNFKIDLLKCICIIFVILIHSISLETRNLVGGPYYMLQAVPIFILISGMNFTNSIENRGISLEECYKRKNLFPRISRVIIPFIVIYSIELIVIILIKGERISISYIINNLIQGGWGPGGYYVPLMIQLIIIIPIMIKLTKVKPNLILIITFFISFIFEIIIFKIQLSNSVYRLLLIRYIFALELGVYYTIKKVKFNKYILIGMIFSLTYITAVEYFGYIPLAHPNWRSQNTLAYLYPFAVFVIVMQSDFRINSAIEKIIKKIGQASYHIFLIQMFYFWVAANVVRSLVGNKIISILINLALCLIGGIVFYNIENEIRTYRKGKQGDCIISST